MNQDMILSIAANTKGEVVIGYGPKVSVIVDDVFRRHHVFKMSTIFARLKDGMSTSTNSELGDEWMVNSVICSKSSNLFGCLVNLTYIISWRRIVGSDRMCDTWELIELVGPSKKNVTAFDFTSDDKYLIICDIGGNVMSFDLTSKTLTALFTNISAITSMTLSADGKYLATADSDFRIRISNFPNSFDIEQFCIGHTEIISHMLVTKHFLVSGSEDGTVKFWNPRTSHVEIDIPLDKYLKIENTVLDSMHHHCRNKRIVVLMKGSSTFFWFDYTKRRGIKKTYVSDLPFPLHIITSCWDFHGLFWAGTGNKEKPFIMFFIDLEQNNIYEVDEAQDHRYKAVVKHIFSARSSPKKSALNTKSLSYESDC